MKSIEEVVGSLSPGDLVMLRYSPTGSSEAAQTIITTYEGHNAKGRNISVGELFVSTNTNLIDISKLMALHLVEYSEVADLVKLNQKGEILRVAP